MKNLAFAVLLVCTLLGADSNVRITIDRIDQLIAVDEARYYAADIIQAHQQRFTASLVIAGTITTAFLVRWFSKKYNEQGLHEFVHTLDQKIEVATARIDAMQAPSVPPAYVPVAPSAPPAERSSLLQSGIGMAKKIPGAVGDIIKKVPGTASNIVTSGAYVFGYGLVFGAGNNIAPMVTVPGINWLGSLLRGISITTFVEDHTNFNTHVLSALEAFEESISYRSSIPDDRKTVLFLTIEHAGNCIMRDLERIMGYLEAVARRIPDHRLSEYQAQEKQFLQNYVLTLNRVGDHIADLLEQVTIADYDKLVELAHAFRNESQRIYNDCHALANVENLLQR